MRRVFSVTGSSKSTCALGSSGSRAMSVMSGQDIVKNCKEHTLWSWSAQQSVNPIAMVKAKGIYFWDADGKKYTDLNSQLMCTNIGHQHPKVIQAIKDQADELCFAAPSMATRVRAEFGPLLAKHTPGDLNKFFFTLGGSEANENALKFAKLHTGRNKVISRFKAYHGASHASMMLTGDSRRWPNEKNGMSGVVRVFDPYMYRSLLYREGMPEEEFSALMVQQLEETILYENPNDIAAMFLETVTGTNGLIPPPKGYLKGVRDVLTKYGIMMIADEVMCGLGRTGAWFAVDHYDVVPDILCMAKGITSAYLPLGVVAVSPSIAKSFDDKMFSGGLTYNAHPMCLAAGVATLKVMEDERIVEAAKETGVHMRALLERMKERHVCVGDVRSIGLFGGMELVKNRRSKESIVPPLAATCPALQEYMAFVRSKGVFMFNAGNILHTNPPLIITKEQLDEAFEVVDQGLHIIDAICDK